MISSKQALHIHSNDLAVLITYSSRSFYWSVYYDDGLEGLDNRKKINFLNTVRDICKEHDLQYILTVIESDIPRDEMDKIAAFPDKPATKDR
jgi:uncharacterized protein YydD (DUF2326 family)